MAEADPKSTALDARTAPVAVWQVLERMSKEELAAWRVAEPKNRASIADRNLDTPFPFGWYVAMLSSELARRRSKASPLFLHRSRHLARGGRQSPHG